MKLCTSEQMRALEQAAVDAGTSLDDLMEQAGLAVAQEVWLNLGVVAGRRVLVLVGPGNNGGDGLVAARHLADWDADLCVYMLAARDGDKNLDLVRERNVTVFNAGDDSDFTHLSEALDGAEVVVDALLGTGKSRQIEGPLAEILRRLNERCGEDRAPKVFAVDVPTGVDADSGNADPLAVTADTTVTFGVAKVGLYTLPGSEYAGRVEVVEIGLPKAAVDALGVELVTTPWVRKRLPKRPKSGNKGTFGKVLVVGGSREYVGAPRLAAEGCYRAGAGLVRLAVMESLVRMIAPVLPEVVWTPLLESYGRIDRGIVDSALLNDLYPAEGHDVLLIGPGLGEVQELVTDVLFELPAGLRGCVIDADALNALGRTLQQPWFTRIDAQCVLTPHPGEMARLLGEGATAETVQADRLGSVTHAAKTWGQTVVLKGAHTIVAAPDGRAAISPYANPLLAVAGTGDVLAGVIAGLLAQRMSPFEAAACGVYVHGLAAEELSEELGDRGLLASELLPAIPRAMRTILHGKAARAGPPMQGGIGDLSAMLAGLGGGAPEPL